VRLLHRRRFLLSRLFLCSCNFPQSIRDRLRLVSACPSVSQCCPCTPTFLESSLARICCCISLHAEQLAGLYYTTTPRVDLEGPWEYLVVAELILPLYAAASCTFVLFLPFELCSELAIPSFFYDPTEKKKKKKKKNTTLIDPLADQNQP
jgi:hypothetical protein